MTQTQPPNTVNDKTITGATETNNDPDNSPWYALRIFCSHQKEIAETLQAHGYEIFIPMELVGVEDSNRHIKQHLRPVVRNLLFIKKKDKEATLRQLIQDIRYPISVIKKEVGSNLFYEIPAHQMSEFQAMCNPDILEKQYLGEEQARLKIGTEVIVAYGPLKGLRGRLVRFNKRYFLLKEVPGMGVMLKVTRWCCKAI